MSMIINNGQSEKGGWMAPRCTLGRHLPRAVQRQQLKQKTEKQQESGDGWRWVDGSDDGVAMTGDMWLWWLTVSLTYDGDSDNDGDGGTWVWPQ